MILPGTTVRAVQNDVALNLMRPAELVSLSDYPQSWAPESQDRRTFPCPHGLLVDVTVDSHGQMTDYTMLCRTDESRASPPSGPDAALFALSPMRSFGRPTAGGHVVLSFSAVRVRG